MAKIITSQCTRLPLFSRVVAPLPGVAVRFHPHTATLQITAFAEHPAAEAVREESLCTEFQTPGASRCLTYEGTVAAVKKLRECLVSGLRTRKWKVGGPGCEASRRAQTRDTHKQAPQLRETGLLGIFLGNQQGGSLLRLPTLPSDIHGTENVLETGVGYHRLRTLYPYYTW